MMMCPDNTHSTTVNYSYDNANRMTAAGGYTYGYDADGNRTSVTNGTTTNYTFDLEDRLTGIGTGVSYDYIGASTDRYSKTVSGTTTQFLYDNGSVDEETQGTTYTAIYGAAAEKLGANTYWMLQDGQGSTRQLLDSSQATVSAYITDAYGNPVSSSGSAANPFKWNGGSGYYSDAESGLQKVGARYYEPATGRWISQDSLLIAGSPVDGQALNRYAYCEGNPVLRTDPQGHQEGQPGETNGLAVAVFFISLAAQAFGWEPAVWLAFAADGALLALGASSLIVGVGLAAIAVGCVWLTAIVAAEELGGFPPPTPDLGNGDMTTVQDGSGHSCFGFPCST